MARRLSTRAPEFARHFDSLVSSRRDAEEDVAQVVRGIVADVRVRGDAALIALSERLDKIKLTPETIRVSPGEVDAAEAQCSSSALSALDVAANRIESFH